MKLHANASLSLKARERMTCRVIEEGWTITKAAEAAEVSVQTCSKWVARARVEGAGGLLDRSSGPHVVANRTGEQTIEAIAALRRLRMTGPQIAEVLDRPLSTISGILTRIGMGKLGRLGLEPVERYERARPGELIHIDVKKLGRIHGGAGKRITGRKTNAYKRRVDGDGKRRNKIGWDFVHVAIDDATRMAYAEVLPDEKAVTAIAFLRRAVKQEERHVEFGEQQTAKAIEGKPWLRRRLLGLSLVSMWGVRRLAGFMEKRLPPGHPVLQHLPAFLAHANRCAELRLRRIGVLDGPLSEISGAKRAALVAEAYGGKVLGGLGSLVMVPFRLLPFWPKRKRLTDTYLSDAHITGFSLTAGSESGVPGQLPQAQEP